MKCLALNHLLAVFAGAFLMEPPPADADALPNVTQATTAANRGGNDVGMLLVASAAETTSGSGILYPAVIRDATPTAA